MKIYQFDCGTYSPKIVYVLANSTEEADELLKKRLNTQNDNNKYMMQPRTLIDIISKPKVITIVEA